MPSLRNWLSSGPLSSWARPDPVTTLTTEVRKLRAALEASNRHLTALHVVTMQTNRLIRQHLTETIEVHPEDFIEDGE